MKTITSHWIIALFLMPVIGFSQSIHVIPVQALIANSPNNAMMVNIPETNTQNAVLAWRKLMKKYGSKLQGNTEFLAEKAKIKAISPDLVDVYAIFVQKVGYVELTVAFRTGTGFINPVSAPVAYTQAEKIVKDFAVDHAREVVRKLHSDEKSHLKKLSKQEKKLRKLNRKLSKSIEKYNRRISDAQKQIDGNQANIEKILPVIETRKAAISILERKLREIR
jgi:hypothetical protein